MWTFILGIITKILDLFKSKEDRKNAKEKLINTTEKQTKLLSNNMYINQLQINRLKRELEILKDDYAAMIVKSYKSRSEQSRAMFLLSSEYPRYCKVTKS
jgi:uncharacterized protein involved in exopolysaccharide biosynthesis